MCLLVTGFVLNSYFELVLIETLLMFGLTINKIGRGIILRELIAFHSSFVVLFMPLIGYTFYTIENPLARLWKLYMPIESISYFSIVFPAVIVYNTILCWPISSFMQKDEGDIFIFRFKKSVEYLNSSNHNPTVLLIIGSLTYFIQIYLPTSLQYISNLIFLSSFSGFLMLYSSTKTKGKLFYIVSYTIFLFFISITTSMFTIIVYMGMTISSFLFLNVTFSFWRKIILTLSVLFGLLFLQNFKNALRGNFSNNDQTTVFQTIGNTNFFNPDGYFLSYARANQGLALSRVINYIPAAKEFDFGSYLGKAFLSSFIPRLFWPDKPEAGGRFTTSYFTGNELVGRTSMNVSPVGEAYGSFGPIFGIVYMAVLALFIRGVYLLFISLTNTIPFLIFWFPVVFFQLTYSMETDSLQIFNSLVKSGIFVFILYIIFPRLFGVDQTKQ